MSDEAPPRTIKKKLGKKQLFVLSYMQEARNMMYPGCGIEINSWTIRILDSLVKHGLVEKSVIPQHNTAPEIPVWKLTQAGRNYSKADQ